MTLTVSPTRRAMLAGLAATAASPALAKAPMLGMSVPKYRRVLLGDFEVTTLLAGSRRVENPHAIFGQNASDAEFEAVSKDAMIPTDEVQFFFTPVIVNTGSELVLFDTGLNSAGLLPAMEQAGYSADQIDKVVITHMHGDHIGGLMTDGAPTFANASYVTGRVEYDAWAKAENQGFDSKVKPLAEKMSFIEGGAAAAPGITSMEAFGHTPGHMAYILDSNGKTMLLGADFANHYVWSLAQPDWEVKFDMDKSAAAATRRKMLDMLATDQMPFSSYHMPFPATGFVARRGDGFAYEPTSYQLML